MKSTNNNSNNNNNNYNNNNKQSSVDNSFVLSGKDWKQTGVHPSWAAKQLQKEQSTKMISLKPQGKKIVFED